ncbi:MAG: FtsW/RodA/SpoVE family cell cycle protein [Chthoniobacteraceae bacterium]
MTPLLRKLLGMNWLLFAAVIVISLAGILFIHGASYVHPSERYWQQQAKWVGVGLFVFLAVTLVDYRWVKWAAVPMYLVSIALVAMTYTGLGVTKSGATCWLRLPGIGVFQPSQIALVGGILSVALFLTLAARWHPALRILCTGIIVAPTMLLILKQPDFGMTLVWVPAVLAMLWLCGMPLRWLMVVILLGLTALPLVINFALKPYQRDRIVTFMDPDVDPRGTSYAVNQSLIAIGSAGFTGKGFKAPDSQLELGLIPANVAHTDYIFATIGEQWGFLGGIAVIGAFGVLLIACLLTAMRSTDLFGVLIVGGITAQVFFHVYQNIGMTIALMPITGLPLPLVSYGGTFAVMLMFALGLVNSVWVHAHAPDPAGKAAAGRRAS